ncbi:MAG: acyl-CoA desaturase [Methylobacter sp.]
MENNYQHIKFSKSVRECEFADTLSIRINNYFRENDVPIYGNYQVIIKAILGFSVWVISYLYLISDTRTTFELVCAFTVNGLAQLHMGLNIAHDANHGAFAKSKSINRLFGYVFDIVGLSSYMWRLMHNNSHHFFVNIKGADSAVGYGGFFRVTPSIKRKPYHRYQHIYAPLLYCLATLDWVFLKDYRCLRLAKFGNYRVKKHPTGELFILFSMKGFYYFYMIILPLFLLSLPWYSVILSFLIMHFILGFILAYTFQPNHFTEKSNYAEPDRNGYINDSYINHVFNNTADYARKNLMMCWSIGGLNLHVAHHMYPKICHIHYPAVTAIIKSTADEYGITYHENKTLTGAFIKHLAWIKRLGNEELLVDNETINSQALEGPQQIR